MEKAKPKHDESASSTVWSPCPSAAQVTAHSLRASCNPSVCEQPGPVFASDKHTTCESFTQARWARAIFLTFTDLARQPDTAGRRPVQQRKVNMMCSQSSCSALDGAYRQPSVHRRVVSRCSHAYALERTSPSFSSSRLLAATTSAYHSCVRSDGNLLEDNTLPRPLAESCRL